MSREVRVPRSDRDMALHQRICDWLRANGIPPGDVPVNPMPRPLVPCTAKPSTTILNAAEPVL